MARPRAFDEEKVLNAIKNVFWQHGYEGASYPDLIEASGLHKGSLYAAFGDKRALYIKALEAYDEKEVYAAVHLLTGESADAPEAGRDRVLALLQLVVDAVVLNGDRRGCLLCNAAVDQAPVDTAVEQTVAASMQKLQTGFEAALADAYAGDGIKNAASAAGALYLGMRVMVKSGASASMLQQALEGARALL